jgi:hypothetical protein
MFAYAGHDEPVHQSEPQSLHAVRSARRLACHVLGARAAKAAAQNADVRDEGKIMELALRGEAWQTSEDRQLLDYAIAKGEGGVYLRLTPEQYRKLRRARASEIVSVAHT